MHPRQELTCALACAVTLIAASAHAAASPSEVMARTDAQLGQLPTSLGELPVRGPANAEEDRTLAPYFAQPGGDRAVETLPLKATHAEVEVAGMIARVRLRQTFENTGTTPIEAVYVFPASTRAAVHGMRMRIGERTIEARIEKREVARQAYESAKAAGQRASLLEQQRPNVFTTRVANLMPRDRIEVELEYSELLIPKDAIYELVVPTVVGPRYGGGADPNRDEWISNPYLPAGEKEPYAFDVQVELRTALTLKEVQSPSHPIDVAYDGQDRARVTLAKQGGGNRDFVLRYRLAGEEIEAGVLLGGDERERYFAVVLEPPARVKPTQLVPREYLFVVDVSGSMHGFPLDTAKELMRNLLGSLRETEHFNVVLFSGAAATFSERSVKATTENIGRATSFVDAARGGGGTELLGALNTAYAIPAVGEGVSRSVVLVTDGYVGVEAQAFKFVRERLHTTNLFAFGIGSSVNRGLIEGLARAGSGEPYVVLDPSTAAAKAEAFRAAIDSPVLTDISVRFHGFAAYEVAPAQQPDLMANRPLVLFGKYRGEPGGEIEVTGMAAGRSFSQRLSVATASTRTVAPALKWLWARKWVELLEDQYALTGAKEVEEAITDLGLSHRLLTPFTSFVAIDTVVANQSGKSTTVKQPLPLPQGVPNSAVGGKSAGLLGSSGGHGAIGSSMGNLFNGSGGYGARGSGAGGGGTGLGLGGIGTKGRGGGVGGYGSAGQASADQGSVRLDSDAKVTGAIDKNTIIRVVKRHQAQVKYCYERSLKTNPTLQGKVVVTFVIDAKGQVAEAKVTESTLKDETVEACLLKTLRRWKFPQAGDGAPVTVSYSWVFKLPEK